MTARRQRKWHYEPRYRVTLIIDFKTSPNFGDTAHALDELGESPDVVQFRIDKHDVQVYEDEESSTERPKTKDAL